MMRSSLFCIAALSLASLAAACAHATVDPIDNSTADQNATAPTDSAASAKLPPPSQGATDAGTKDSGTSSSSSSSSTSSSSSSSSSSGSSGSSGASGSTSSSSSSSSGGAGGAACDPSNAVYAGKAILEVGKASPRVCSFAGTGCAVTECCFTVYQVCVDL